MKYLSEEHNTMTPARLEPVLLDLKSSAPTIRTPLPVINWFNLLRVDRQILLISPQSFLMVLVERIRTSVLLFLPSAGHEEV